MTEPQETQQHDEPNDYGFAGGATTPSPERGSGESRGESIAVPAGDVTGSLMSAIDDPGHDDEPGAGEGRR
jgi:hypothetical protein